MNYKSSEFLVGVIVGAALMYVSPYIPQIFWKFHFVSSCLKGADAEARQEADNWGKYDASSTPLSDDQKQALYLDLKAGIEHNCTHN